jgi:hypothetical protein
MIHVIHVGDQVAMTSLHRRTLGCGSYPALIKVGSDICPYQFFSVRKFLMRDN